jgi:hypothetical protein
MIEIV